MDRQQRKWVTWGIVVLIAAAVVLMLTRTLHRPDAITLPDTSSSADASAGDDASGDALTVVEVTPDTVQTAIATLSRPESYRRTVTVEQFWSGGSGSYEITVSVYGDWTRMDRTMPDGRVRHTILGPENVYIWYNSDQNVYTGPAGEITADNEQSIPTYEDILTIPVSSITAADYRTTSDVPCIYVEAQEDGYTLRYWVSLETGLLVAAEKLEAEETVYRMASLTVEESDSADFTLPDGTSLLSVKTSG